MASRAFNHAGKKPIIYTPDYDIVVAGIEELHPVDTRKSSNVFNQLVRNGVIAITEQIEPEKASDADLALAHTPEYLKTLDDREALSKIFEVPSVKRMPLEQIQKEILDPLRYQAGGSALAAQVALEEGWAINLGGGFHHASSDRGHGFCPIADISIAIKKLRADNPHVKKVMIIDLDAHQGDGYARDFMRDDNVFIVDVYNKNLFPKDEDAQFRINVGQGLPLYTDEGIYLQVVERVLFDAKRDFTPDIILYVAGTDILEGDKLGRSSVSAQGIIRRDELVFEYALGNNIPIAMVFGGGYQPNNAKVIADSIENLDRSFGLMSKPIGPR